MNRLGMTLQDKYKLSGTKPPDYLYDKDGNAKLDTAGYPIKRINSSFTADILPNETNQIDKDKK